MTTKCMIPTNPDPSSFLLLKKQPKNQKMKEKTPTLPEKDVTEVYIQLTAIMAGTVQKLCL